MLFSSMTFLFLFLPIVCAVYLIVSKRFKNDVLLLASFFFYAWGEPHYVLIMLLSIGVNYSGALLLEKIKLKKCFLILMIFFNLGVLI